MSTAKYIHYLWPCEYCCVILMLAASLLFPLVAVADSAHVAKNTELLTLETAVGLSLAHQPSVSAAWAQTQAAESERRAAAHALLPSLSLHAGDKFSRAQNSTPDYFVSDSGRREISGQLVLDQALYDPRKLSMAAAARAQADFARFAALRSQLSVAKATARAFYSLRDKESAVQIWQGTLEQARLLLADTHLGYEAGTRTRLDLVRSQAQVTGAESALAVAQVERNTAGQLLSLMTGREPLPPLAPPREIAVDLQLPTMADLHQVILTRRPELGMAQAEVARSQALFQEAEGAWKPQLHLQAAYGWDTLATPTSMNLGWSAGLNLEMPLFDWGMLRDHEDAARFNLQASQAQQKETVLKIDAEFEQALGNAQAAMAAFKVNRQLVEQNADIYHMSQKGYQAGRLSGLDLALARKEWVQTQIQQEQGRFNLRLALVELDLITGALSAGSEELP
jgi:outer membrane protein TolC